MTVGAVLIQADRLRRAGRADPALGLATELFNLGARLATDRARGGRVAEVAETAALDALQALVDARLARFTGAAPRVAQWAERVLRAVTGLGRDLRIDTPAAGLELVRNVLASVAQALRGGSAAGLRPHLAELLAILEQDLGLGLPALETALWQVVDDVCTRLEALPPETDPELRANRVDTVRLLRRIRRLVRGRFPLPRLDADVLADALAALLRRHDAEALAARVQCVADALGQAAAAGRTIEDLVPLGGMSEFRHLGAAAAAAAAEEQYLWYASWLLGGDVVLNAERTEIRLADRVLASGTGLGPADLPFFKTTTTPRYVFPRVSLDALETMAFVSAVSVDAVNLVLHAVSLEEGDYASNILNGLSVGVVGVSKLHSRRVLLPGVVEDFVLPTGWSLLTSFEGLHTKASAKNGFLMWLTLFLPDIGETYIYRFGAGGARDFLLSFFTLINYDGPFTKPAGADTRPLNRQHIDGVAGVFAALMNRLLMLSFPREDYAQPFQSGDQALKLLLFWWLLMSTLFTVLSRIFGALVAMGIGRNFDFAAWKHDWWKQLLKGTAMFFPNLYLTFEGDTADGTYNPGQPGYAGYPPADSSPYTLPYPAGQSVYVGQANQGVFSHNALNINQTYAYDFSMDQGDVILAGRPGTVVDWFDWVPDDQDVQTTGDATVVQPGQTSSDNWNFVAIRHDVDDSGAAITPDPVHDRGAGGATVVTYAVYGHGRNGSVRELFANRGVAPGAIIGARVRRGDAIMRAGDTGISFHNHLHMHVVPGPPVSNTPPVSRGNFGRTVPFVFQDVKHFIGRDGVCRNLNWYTSSTVQAG